MSISGLNSSNLISRGDYDIVPRRNYRMLIISQNSSGSMYTKFSSSCMYERWDASVLCDEEDYLRVTKANKNEYDVIIIEDDDMPSQRQGHEVRFIY